MQVAAERLAVLRDARRLFHLPEDLRLAQDHGVETAGDAKRMTHRLLVRQGVEVLVEAVVADAVMLADPLRQRLAGLAGGVRLAVDLGAIAGGQDGRFRRKSFQALAQVRQGAADGVDRRERDLLTKRQRRCRMVESEGQQCHQERVTGLWRQATYLSVRRQRPAAYLGIQTDAFKRLISQAL